MNFLFEMLPVILFFAAYKLYAMIPAPVIEAINRVMPFTLNAAEKADSIYFATLVGILVAGISVFIYYLKTRSFEKNQSITFILFLLFGGATLLLRDPTFIKWKPTVINLIFALIFLGSMFIGKMSLIERFMGKAIEAPREIWTKLNLAWVVFFIAIAGLNLYIAYAFSEEIWVNFKLFGVIGLTILFMIIQMIILNRYVIAKPKE